MKVLSFLAAAVLGCSALFGQEPQKVETLAAKAVMTDTTGYFVLSDGSVWKTIPFVTRQRSLSEWWNDIQLVPENYECVPNDWVIGSQVEVYSKYRNLNISESDASNEYLLKQCTHLLVNSHTGQVLFAVALNPVEAIMQLFTEAKAEGYSSGYSSGYRQGHGTRPSS